MAGGEVKQGHLVSSFKKKLWGIRFKSKDIPEDIVIP